MLSYIDIGEENVILNQLCFRSVLSTITEAFIGKSAHSANELEAGTGYRVCHRNRRQSVSQEQAIECVTGTGYRVCHRNRL